MGVTSLEKDCGEDVVNVVPEELFLFTEDLARTEVDEVAEDLLRVGAGAHLLTAPEQDVMFLGQHGRSQARQSHHGGAGCGLRPEEELQQQVQHFGV